jgi:23S rRNA (guanine745-N1)-methyltransferase
MIALRCPVCSQSLAQQDRSWRCEAGHCFDISREGYINLLLVQQKHSKEPGDNPEMVQARRDFLAAGFYAPLLESALGLLRPLKAQSLLDIGAGEGYYTNAFAEIVPEVLGLDIAKPAIQIAAKKFRNITWVVGSAAALPVADAAVDLVCSLFSPLPMLEMQRVLKPGAYLLLATPAPRHLWQLRKALFDEVLPHDPEKFLDELSPGFKLVERMDIRFPLALPDQSQLRNLLLMTPYYWRALMEKREKLLALDSFADEAQFSLMLMQRQEPAPAITEPEISPD